MTRLITAFVFILVGHVAFAGGVIKVSGALSNEDFYKAVSCGAAPGKACTDDILRWSKGKAGRLTVSLHFPAGMPAGDQARFVNALSNGILTINAAGTQVNLSRVANDRKADIVVSIIDPAEMELLNKLSTPKKGVTFVAHTNVSANNGKISKANVTINKSLGGTTLNSIMASNLLSALGFLSNVDGGPYGSRSLLAGHANNQTKLTGQDLVALRMHYPK